MVLTRTWMSGAAWVPVVIAGLAMPACGSNDLEPIRDAGASDAKAPTGKDAGKADATASHDAGPVGDDTGDPDTGIVEHPDTGVFACKRGIASNATPVPDFVHRSGLPGITWWYDWALDATSTPPAGIDFVPMVWGTMALGGPLPGGASWLMGFNEPNFKNQSNMTPQEAASHWPDVESLANQQGLPIVAPGLNFCGNCSDPAITDPYTWLKDFFAACNGCRVDAIAVHWYNCDLPSLQAYIDGNASLEGYTQFKKPIWLTEFSCDDSHPPAEQEAYMRAAIPYLESNVNVARYSWFSADAIPNARLMDNNGLTSLGQTYVSLPANCGQ